MSRLVKAALLSGMAMLAAFAPTDSLWAQVTTGDIRGTVVDDVGLPIEGVQIIVTDTRTNTTFGTLTNERGRYLVPHLRPGGPYTVTAQSIGYRAQTRTGAAVTLSQSEDIDFRLETSAVEVEALTVSVEAQDAVISKSRTGAQTTVPTQEIESFPTINRQLNDFAALSPYSNSVEGAPSFSGQNNRFNNIQIDGAVNNDVFGLADSGVPGGQAGAKPISIEAIEEIQILVTPFDVRQANFTGGLINAVTKSGTNEWEWTGFGFFSNENLVSANPATTVGEFNDTQFGLSVGGPLVKDKVFFFAAGEGERNDSPTNAGITPGTSTELDPEFGFSPASAAEMINILSTTYGVDAGTTAQVSLENPRTNIFTRFDFYLSDKHRLVTRWNFSKASADLAPFRETFSYALTSNIAPFNSTTNSFVANLFSRFNDTWSNELLFNLEFVRDKRDPAVTYGQVEVNVDDNTLVAGAERFSQFNELRQNIFQLTNNFTGNLGDHQVTFGTSNQFFDFFNAFEPGSIGVWDFDSLADLQANNPSNYVKRVSLGVIPVEDLPAQFNAFQLGFYVQDEWTASDNLTLTLGFRVDIPFLPDDPANNPEFEQAFGISTTTVPSGNPLWQPRFGFNWQSGGERITQLRGGIGLFAGRAPYVWLSNAYGNTGVGSVDLVCSAAGTVPQFTPNGPGPDTCLDGSGAQQATQRVNIIDPDFKFPLDLKISAGIDQQLAGGWVGTLEFLYTKAVESVFFEEINLLAPTGTDPIDGRDLFGDPTVSSSCDGGRGVCRDDTRIDDRFAQVVNLTNRSQDRAFVVVAGVERQFADWLAFRGSYTFSDVEDLQGLFSSQATSNYGRSAIGVNPNDPPRTTSSFERRHKAVISATGSWEFGNGFLFQVTPQFFGQSGSPYSYVIRGDPNGDGYRDPVISRDNDLIYIPNNISELTFRTPEDAANFDALIEANECLSEQRGQIMERNSCTAPWAGRLDMRFVFGIPVGRPGQFQIIADVLNLTRSVFEEPSNIDRGLEALRVRGRVNDDPNGDLILQYRGPSADSDRLPFQIQTTRSSRRWQIGGRFNFN